MSVKEEGQIQLLLKNPLSSENVSVNNLKKYLEDENNILIYLDDDPMPYCMKRTYFINLLAEDFDYECKSKKEVNTSIKYYNLSKLFLNIKGKPSIVIKMDDIKIIISDPNIRYFKLKSVINKATKKPIKKLTYTNIDLQKINYKEGPDYISHKWEALESYCGNDYVSINKYLVRLTDMPNSSSIIFDFPLIKLIISSLGLSKKETKKLLDPRENNDKIQRKIDDIDHIFLKYAKISKEPKVVYRQMETFYTYLKEPGDKMVVENYMSCFDNGGGMAVSSNFLCNITIKPGIPYFQTYLDEEFREYLMYPEEREVLLPRNLVATYEGETNGDWHERKAKLITLSPLYPSQFKNELICNERTLYKIQIGDDNLSWINVKQNNSISRKIKKMKNKIRTTLRITHLNP